MVAFLSMQLKLKSNSNNKQACNSTKPPDPSRKWDFLNAAHVFHRSRRSEDKAENSIAGAHTLPQAIHKCPEHTDSPSGGAWKSALGSWSVDVPTDRSCADLSHPLRGQPGLRKRVADLAFNDCPLDSITG